MASLSQKKSGIWYVSYRVKIDGVNEPFYRSCETKKKKDARKIQLDIEQTIKQLKTGQLVAPPGVTLGDYVYSGGTLTVQAAQDTTLAEACAGYLAESRKAENTRKGEEKHINHLKEVIGGTTRLARVTLKTLKRYRDKRRKTANRYGGKVSDGTIKKELLTFSQIWGWALTEKHVTGPCPLKNPHNTRKWALALDKPEDRQEFETWEQVEKRIKREGIKDDKQKRGAFRWVYLDEKQVGDLLDHVKGESPIYVALVLAACAGMRRSEILNAEIGDVRLSDGLLLVREMKRKKSKAGTFRRIPIRAGSRLHQTLKDWLARHPGGAFLITDKDREPWTDDAANLQFKRAVKGSKWSVLPGYHCLRHSFGSICLRKQIPIHITAKWMGHTTDEMVRLYQHIFPQDETDSMKNFPL